MINKLPGYYRKSKVVQDIYTAIRGLFDKLEADIAEKDLNLFLMTATDITNHEKNVGLTPIVADTETKRSRVLTRLRGNDLLTPAELKALIEAYDKTGCTIVEDFANYTVTVIFSGRTGQPYNLDQIKAAVEEVKPAHIQVLYEFTENTWLDIRLKLNTWGNAKTRTWGDVRDYDGRTWLYVDENGEVYLQEDNANAYVVFKGDEPYAQLL